MVGALTNSECRGENREPLRSNSGEDSMGWFIRREELGDAIQKHRRAVLVVGLVASKIEKYEESRNDERSENSRRTRLTVPRSDTRNTKELTQTQATSTPIDITSFFTITSTGILMYP